MRSLNRGSRSMTGTRIHRLMEARANCVPDPSPEELDRELKQIMAPCPRTVNEDLPGRARRWRPPRTSLALGGILACASAALSVEGLHVHLAAAGPAVAWVADFSAVVLAIFAVYVGIAMVAVLRTHDAHKAEIRYRVFRDLLGLFLRGRR
jgi:hypothetical protein